MIDGSSLPTQKRKKKKPIIRNMLQKYDENQVAGKQV
jgi:hypothetical protein